MLRRRMARRQEEARLEPVVDAADPAAPCRRALEDVAVEDSIGRYIVALAAATREHPQVLVGASPRGSLALLLLARAAAALAGRDYVIPEDVKAVAVAGAGAPDHAAAGDVAAPGRPGARGRRGARADAGPGQRRAARRYGRQRPCPSRRRREPARPDAGRAGSALRAARASAGRRRWAPTRALGRAVLLAGLLLLLAVLLGRVDLVVLAAPFALGTALGAARAGRPRAAGLRGRRRPSRSRSRAAESTRTVRASRNPRPGRLRPGRGPAAPLAAGCELDARRPAVRASTPAPRRSDRRASTLRAGRRLRLGPPRRSARPPRYGVGRATACCVSRRRSRAGALALRVYPVTEPFEPTRRCPARPALVGGHRSRRPGEGGELAGVRRFGPGDRLRRIDWRVTLRTRRAARRARPCPTATPRWCVLLDVLHEAGRSGGIDGPRVGAGHHGPGGGRDRRALPAPRRPGGAAGVRRRRPAGCARPAAAGSYMTALEWLLDVAPEPEAADEPTPWASARTGAAQRAGRGAHPAARPAVRRDARQPGPGRPLRGRRRHAAALRRPAPRTGPWAPVAHRLWRPGTGEHRSASSASTAYRWSPGPAPAAWTRSCAT